jgi:dihydroorotate dehydrogenase electron transfer subunit
MKNVVLKIEKNERVGNDIYLMRLAGDTSDIKNPGEFINITVPGYYLRRPISVHRFSNNYVEILYKVLGNGTLSMSTFPVGMELDCLVGLGNGFDITKSKKPLLVAGGIGIAPMFALIDEFNKLGIKPTLVYGSQCKADLVLVEELSKITDLRLTTDNGECGFHGHPVKYLSENQIDFDYYYSCGPLRMLEGLAKYSFNGCLSLEARMGCGFGACMGCTIKTTNGNKRVCKEGPVFDADEVIF